MPATINAQEQDENDPAKAAALVREAIKARGGDAYLKFRTVASQGQYTPFEKGLSESDCLRRLYRLSRPRAHRVWQRRHKFIQTNSESANWIYDAKQKMIREQTEEQIKKFQQSARYDLDNLLRAASSQTGVKLVYLGRREPGATFSEAVRLDFADGGTATLHFDPRTKLPLRPSTSRSMKRARITTKSRYYRWVDFNGIQFPTIRIPTATANRARA